MKNEIPYDLLIADTESEILTVINKSGLTIATVSLIIDNIKNNLDHQKHDILKTMRLQEEAKKAIINTK